MFCRHNLSFKLTKYIVYINFFVITNCICKIKWWEVFKNTSTYIKKKEASLWWLACCVDYYYYYLFFWDTYLRQVVMMSCRWSWTITASLHMRNIFIFHTIKVEAYYVSCNEKKKEKDIGNIAYLRYLCLALCCL